jgi:hypothetical protein
VLRAVYNEEMCILKWKLVIIFTNEIFRLDTVTFLTLRLHPLFGQVVSKIMLTSVDTWTIFWCFALCRSDNAQRVEAKIPKRYVTHSQVQ